MGSKLDNSPKETLTEICHTLSNVVKNSLEDKLTNLLEGNYPYRQREGKEGDPPNTVYLEDISLYISIVNKEIATEATIQNAILLGDVFNKLIKDGEIDNKLYVKIWAFVSKQLAYNTANQDDEFHTLLQQ